MCPISSLQLIYNFPEQLFADAGIMAIEHADFDGIERLALVTGEEQNMPKEALSCSSGSHMGALCGQL